MFVSCQTVDTRLKSDGFSGISNKEDFYSFAKTLSLGITEEDDYQSTLTKIKYHLDDYKCVLPDDYYSLMADKAALDGTMKGQYGIGSILVNPRGEIVETAFNSMIMERRSDLHGEMTLMTKFESNHANDIYRKGFSMQSGYTVYSSAEPCPMCMIRLATAEVNTKYNCKNDDDSMSRRLEFLPSFWRELCKKYPCVKANCSKDLSDIAYLLFYVHLLNQNS